MAPAQQFVLEATLTRAQNTFNTRRAWNVTGSTNKKIYAPASLNSLSQLMTSGSIKYDIFGEWWGEMKRNE